MNVLSILIWLSEKGYTVSKNGWGIRFQKDGDVCDVSVNNLRGDWTEVKETMDAVDVYFATRPIRED